MKNFEKGSSKKNLRPQPSREAGKKKKNRKNPLLATNAAYGQKTLLQKKAGRKTFRHFGSCDIIKKLKFSLVPNCTRGTREGPGGGKRRRRKEGAWRIQGPLDSMRIFPDEGQLCQFVGRKAGALALSKEWRDQSRPRKRKKAPKGKKVLTSRTS